MGEKDKGIWEQFKAGFEPASARADAQVRQNRATYGDKLSEDMKQSPEERAKKLREGFMKKFKM